MDTASAPGASGTPLRERLLDHLPDDLSADKTEALVAFAEAYIRRMSEEESSVVPIDRLAAEITSAFHFLDTRGDEPVALRVFTPTIEEHGYRSPGSVVEITVDDAPFLVDSIHAVFTNRGLHVEGFRHPVIGTERDASGRLVAVLPARESPRRESFQRYELGRSLSAADASALKSDLGAVLHDVRVAVRDFEPMRRAVGRMIEFARSGYRSEAYPLSEVDDSIAFLEWLLDLNYVFLGYREYEIHDTDAGPAVAAVPGSGLGILGNVEGSQFSRPVPLSELSPELRSRFESGHLVVVSKTNRNSTVHRDAKMDYIGVRKVDVDGRTIAEGRMVGLFTSKAYLSEAASIPIINTKLAAVIAGEDLIEGSYDYKLIVQLFESFPKDELFTISIPDLQGQLVALLETEEHQQVRLFLRRDLLQRAVSLIVVIPRDRFNSDLRRKLQALFLERLGGSSVDYRLSLGETGDARIHFTVWLEAGQVGEVSFGELESDVLALTRTWEDLLVEALANRVDAVTARSLASTWADRFPEYYRTSTWLSHACSDVIRFDELVGSEERVLVGIDSEKTEELSRIVVYSLDGKRDLSEMLPLLENLGLRVVEEVPTRLINGTDDIFIHDFGVLGPDGRRLDRPNERRITAALGDALQDRSDSDSLHRLLVTCGLDHHQINILRAYRSYWRLVTPAFTRGYVADAFAAHPEIAYNLVRFFEARFGPDGDEADEAELRMEILDDLDAVASLDEDRILRAFLRLIQATLRTNAYRPERGALSFKIRSDLVPEMPQPRPKFEIFVFGRDVAGIHLRGGDVARGGIRWSVRREDYRTEVLGLMKAQMTKNVVIVPTGAKGGFIVRRPADPAGPAREEVAAAYRTFIRALLDVTDNRVKGEVVGPRGVRAHDAGDPYLVVAADRGTATFSDTANEIAAEYGFWLDDAFASGGSAGYDHKALGITARGAWESVRRHFLELGIDVDSEPVTVIGVGDMSGDVFGNGMLLSRQIRLVAAFDHRHVFIDPDPDPDRSYAERERLASVPRSSWADYDSSVISAGGKVWPRTAKRIDLSDEAMVALDVQQASFTPNELISAILRAPVDLMWNGGIGTYVKAGSEGHGRVQDRFNDAVRVNGRDLRCRVVGEGGNLGFTQLGRIEFERNGGRIFADFIDNSGGVHASDREVNLKILLGLAEERGDFDREARDQLVQEVAEEVVSAIVYDNFLQAQILSQEKETSLERIDAYDDLMLQLEEDGLLDRDLEGLPSSEAMAERARDGVAMARPELAVLLAYAKRQLSDALLASDLPDWPHFEKDVKAYFPGPVVERHGDLIPEHPLRREMVATIVANQVLDSQGSTFISRLAAETGAEPAEIVRAYRVARAVTGAGERWSAVEELSGEVEPGVLQELLDGVDEIVETITRWYLFRPRVLTMDEEIDGFQGGFEELVSQIRSVGPGQWRADRDALATDFTERGVPVELSLRHAYQPELVHAPDIIDVAGRTDRSVVDVARVFFRAGQTFQLDWLEEQLDELPARTRWQRWAALTLEQELLGLRRSLAERILAGAEARDADEAVDAFLLAHAGEEGRLVRLLRLLARDGVSDTASVIVALRRIRDLVG